MRRYRFFLAIVLYCSLTLPVEQSAAAGREREPQEPRYAQSEDSLGTSRVSDSVAPALPFESAYQTKWQVIAGGGSTGVSGGYMLGSTLGQTAAGIGTAGTTVVRHGFWQDLSLWASCCYGPTLGNLDHSADGWVTLGDLTLLIDHLYISLEPLVCMEEANLDLSADHLVTTGDLTVMIDHLFISLNPLAQCP